MLKVFNNNYKLHRLIKETYNQYLPWQARREWKAIIDFPIKFNQSVELTPRWKLLNVKIEGKITIQ